MIEYLNRLFKSVNQTLMMMITGIWIKNQIKKIKLKIENKLNFNRIGYKSSKLAWVSSISSSSSFSFSSLRLRLFCLDSCTNSFQSRSSSEESPSSSLIFARSAFSNFRLASFFSFWVMRLLCLSFWLDQASCFWTFCGFGFCDKSTCFLFLAVSWAELAYAKLSHLIIVMIMINGCLYIFI